MGEKTSSVPVELSEINFFLDSHHANVKKVKSSGSNAFFLLDDGKLYVVGKNNGGLLAIRKNPRIIDDEAS